jgi:stage V sporulation protein G
MQVTEIKVFPIEEEKLKAFVSIVFDQCFMVNDIKVIQGKEGLFISMPSRRKRNGKFKDVAHPLNNDTRRMIEDQVLREYERVVTGSAGPRGEAGKAPADSVEQAAQSPAEGGHESTEDSKESNEGKTLEEVAEMHLRDSFWNP